MVFQDPFASLNARMTIGQCVGEPLLVNGILSGNKLRARVGELLSMVGLPADAAQRYPHAFSGGQRQRIVIARALATDPRLVILDEATLALDVTLRGQILDLLLALQPELNLTFILISHDLGVIRYFCNRVAVMLRGKIVEVGSTAESATALSSPTPNACSPPSRKPTLSTAPSSETPPLEDHRPPQLHAARRRPPAPAGPRGHG